MLLILISWLYISFISINLGCLFAKLLSIKNKDFSVTALLGLFATTLLASFWAIFKNIGLEFHICLLFITLVCSYFLRKDIKEVVYTSLSRIKKIAPFFKISLLLNCLLIVAQCATVPYVIDNESYYIQTIKWLNEYGLVKGVGNVHFFLAQTSGWHITQSAFSFSFLYPNFNDISGYCLLLGNIFCILKLNQYFTDKKFHNLVIGMLPLANVFLFQFISAPSPDIPIYILSFIIFSYFLSSTTETYTNDFKLISIFIIYLIFIKTTAVALLLLPLIMFFSNTKKAFSTFVPIGITGVLTLAAFVVKNTIVSGYPLFPIINIAYDCDWIIPKEIAQRYYDETKVYGYLLQKSVYNTMNYKQLFVRWLTLPKLHGVFNLIGMGLILITPIGIYKFKNEKKWWILYLYMLVQMVLLFLSSPQYRFFINTVLLFSFFFATLLFTSQKSLKILFTLSIVAVAYVLFIPIDLNKFAENKFATANSSFKPQEIIIPHSNSKLDTKFEKVTIDNFTFWSPLNNEFFWVSGNGPVPCANKDHIYSFKKRYGVIPQMRGKSLKDGFYAKKTENKP
ncbi:hypothetical protein DVK85_11065 [Flavobacterium arcticum]|uniref:DUF8201 domain-containing protein n=1 Tax=Flavobacterium arcticum TaxID=1784713 RepID=A0A345HDT0_9FLAO|nr:hypothetical protein [Flavobacterium arcticum]AXG74740.1 hypothetical protein DVK85_11065 [Flavobacterium arcticum]KAF2509760.1 hypothetical protein E0W72_09610 [Flavobacterium arcticum]